MIYSSHLHQTSSLSLSLDLPSTRTTHMRMKMSATLSLFSLSIFIHCAYAFDITQILNKNPEFSSFNSYLTQTNLAGAINARQTVTVLVVDNGGMSSLSSKTPDVIKNILRVHVILDYYDVTKLQQLSSGSALLTTLFQSTGVAKGQQGFLSVTHPSAGSTALASAMPGSQPSGIIKSVFSEPYNISVVQISNPILPQGIDGTKLSSPASLTTSATAPTTTTATPPPSATPSSTPPPPAAATPSSAPPPATATARPSMAPTSSSPPTTAVSTTPSSAPTTAATPSAAAAPGGAPTPSVAAAPGEPAETTPAADKPKEKDAASALEIGLAVVCAMALSTLYLTSSI